MSKMQAWFLPARVVWPTAACWHVLCSRRNRSLTNKIWRSRESKTNRKVSDKDTACVDPVGGNRDGWSATSSIYPRGINPDVNRLPILSADYAKLFHI